MLKTVLRTVDHNIYFKILKTFKIVFNCQFHAQCDPQIYIQIKKIKMFLYNVKKCSTELCAEYYGGRKVQQIHRFANNYIDLQKGTWICKQLHRFAEFVDCQARQSETQFGAVLLLILKMVAEKHNKTKLKNFSIYCFGDCCVDC